MNIVNVVSMAFTLWLWVTLVVRDRRRPFSHRFLSAYALAYGGLACVGIVAGWSLPPALADGVVGAWCAYHAWKRRPPRDRKPSRVAGVVRVRGHRLVVTPG